MISSIRGSWNRDATGYFKADSSGRVVARYKSLGESIAGMFGFRSTQVYKQGRASDLIRMYEHAYRTSRKYYINKIAQLIERGDMVRAMQLLQQANATPIPGAQNIWKSHYITRGDLSGNLKNRRLQLTEKGISKIHRAQIKYAIPEVFGD